MLNRQFTLLVFSIKKKTISILITCQEQPKHIFSYSKVIVMILVLIFGHKTHLHQYYSTLGWYWAIYSRWGFLYQKSPHSWTIQIFKHYNCIFFTYSFVQVNGVFTSDNVFQTGHFSFDWVLFTYQFFSNIKLKLLLV